MATTQLTPEQKVHQRNAWFQEAQQLGDVKLACRRLGIWRKTFYKWKTRLTQARGEPSPLSCDCKIMKIVTLHGFRT
jgi:hypothetical protein